MQNNMFILYNLLSNETFTSVLPLIALYAFGGYRILPALQQSYNSISNLLKLYDGTWNSLNFVEYYINQRVLLSTLKKSFMNFIY